MEVLPPESDRKDEFAPLAGLYSRRSYPHSRNQIPRGFSTRSSDSFQDSAIPPRQRFSLADPRQLAFERACPESSWFEWRFNILINSVIGAFPGIGDLFFPPGSSLTNKTIAF